jgi:hypothetical protein
MTVVNPTTPPQWVWTIRFPPYIPSFVEVSTTVNRVSSPGLDGAKVDGREI